MKAIKLRLLIAFACCLALLGATSIYASDPHNSSHHYGRSNERTDGKDEGLSGASGQIAAWLFGIANFPAVLSILLKTCGRVMPQSSNLKVTFGQMNQRQKACLMKLHYWLNPIAVMVAILHFFLTECPTTAMPEIGLGAMLLVCILGIMVTFKWSPAFLRKAVYQFHTSSLTLLAIISFLLIGHSMVD